MFKPEPKTLAQAQAVAEKYDKIINKYVSRPSKWSGTAVISYKDYTYKDWNCDIAVKLADCPDIAIMHELLHARSLSYYPPEIYYANSAIEEATAQFWAEEISKRENFEVTESMTYKKLVYILRDFNGR